MARRSILSPAREQKMAAPVKPEPDSSHLHVAAPEPASKPSSKIKPSRIAKIHVGGYYYPDDPTINAFQKLGIDLRRTQQDMLQEAIRDFVAKHDALRAFG
jgi:hypothetical protein